MVLSHVFTEVAEFFAVPLREWTIFGRFSVSGRRVAACFTCAVGATTGSCTALTAVMKPSVADDARRVRDGTG